MHSRTLSHFEGSLLFTSLWEVYRSHCPQRDHWLSLQEGFTHTHTHPWTRAWKSFLLNTKGVFSILPCGAFLFYFSFCVNLEWNLILGNNNSGNIFCKYKGKIFFLDFLFSGKIICLILKIHIYERNIYFQIFINFN